jgi:hypothetical protein
MKINVALFITALSTTATGRHGVLPVVSAAAAGDDGAAAAAAVDRPHLRALLQSDLQKEAACSAVSSYGSCDKMFCNNCAQGQTHCKSIEYSDLDALWYGVACCNAGKTKCYDPTGTIPGTSLFIKAEEEQEEEVPQDTSTTDKLGDEIEAVVPSSSTLRASSLLKDNVFTKQDGAGAEDNIFEVGTCGPSNDAPSDPCDSSYASEGFYLDCSGCSGKTRCVSSQSSSSGGFGTGNQWSARCCNKNNPNNCHTGSAQADEEDAMIMADKEEEEVPQDIEALDASSPALRASSKDNNVFTKNKPDPPRTYCPLPTTDDNSSTTCPSGFCDGCQSNRQNCVTTNACGTVIGETSDTICIAAGTIHKCCNGGGNHCHTGSAQADEEDVASLLKVE